MEIFWKLVGFVDTLFVVVQSMFCWLPSMLWSVWKDNLVDYNNLGNLTLPRWLWTFANLTKGDTVVIVVSAVN